MFVMCELRVPEKLCGKMWPQYNTERVWSWSLVVCVKGGNKFRFICSKEVNIVDPDTVSEPQQCFVPIVLLAVQ